MNIRKFVFLLFFVIPFLICTGCRIFQKPIGKANHELFSSRVSRGKLQAPEITEASGMAVGTANSGILWVHNDSGDEARLFALSEKGEQRAVYYLQGIKARDWESIASYKSNKTGKSYLFIGDTGDNLAMRKSIKVYRIEEPPVDSVRAAYVDTVSKNNITIYTLSYPKRARDAETMMIDPISEKLYIVSKREPVVSVFAIDLPLGNRNDTLMLKNVGSIPFTKIVSGDISAKGDEILLKNYREVLYWRRKPGSSIEETLINKPPVKLPYKREPQGEAIAWKKDGTGFFTLSEEPLGIEAELYWYKRK